MKGILIAVFLDIKKAYDCVNREKLIKMLKKIGINDQMYKWLKNFLKNDRIAKVAFQNVRSKETVFKRGVPQGSPLSPILFNLYVSEVEPKTSKNISQFADDLVIWEEGQETGEIVDKLNKRIQKLKEWADKMELEFSPEKCESVIFTRKRIQETPKIKMDGKVIEYRSEAKYLGLTFDKKVNWTSHVTTVIKKANRKVGALKFLCNRKGINQDIAITLYKAIIRPRLEYASEIFGDTCKTNKKRLDSVQQKSLASALGVNRLAHRLFLNNEAGVRTLENRRNIRIFKLLVKMKANNKENSIKVEKERRLKSKHRRSFKEMTKELCKKYGDIEKMNKKQFTDEIDKLIVENIRENKYETRKSCFKNNIRIQKGYKKISKSRKINQMWHQARLEVLPLNEFLKEINKKKEGNCERCNKKEDTKHFLIDCKEFNIIENYEKFIKNKKGIELYELLDRDKPPDKKVKICIEIAKALRKRKINNRSKEREKKRRRRK